MTNEFARRPVSKWMEAGGPEADVVISSRIRLARNLVGLAFPHLMEESAAEQVFRSTSKVVGALNSGKGPQFELIPMNTLTPLERLVLVEKHLISPQHAEADGRQAVVLREDEAVSIMINEEDHLRIQCLFPGLQLDRALALANQVDDTFEQYLDYAFSEERGYLTACPTNVGTGLRASVMVHLPALVMTGQAGRILPQISKFGLVVRGMYGEGTEAIGNIFQVSNQISLGPTEDEIVGNLQAVVSQVIDGERQARQSLLRESRDQLEDRVYRSWGVLSNARILTSQEAMQLISDVRLGVDLGLIKEVKASTLNQLLVTVRPGFLQVVADHDLSPYERDVRRATLVRQTVRNQ